MPLAVTGSLQALDTLRQFVSQLEEGIYVTTAAGEILDANAALLGIFGVGSIDELRRFRAQDLWVDPALRAEEVTLFARDGAVRDFEMQLRRLDGSVRTVLDTCTAATDSASGRTLMFGILVDITERKRAEEALAVSLSLHRAILDSTADGLLIVDRDGRIVNFNRRFAELWRLPDDVLSSGDDDRALAAVLGQLREPQRFIDKVRALYAAPADESFDDLEFLDGRVFERYSQPQRVGGEIAGRVWSFRDVTERRRAERQLSLQSSVLGAVANAVVITDPSGIIEWVNPAFTRLTGYSEAEAVGQSTRLLRSGVQEAAVYADLWKTVAAGGVWRGELVNRRKDESLYHEQMTITPVRGADGKVLHYVAIKEDVTERRRIDQRMRDAQRLEAVGRLAGGVAHDFNNLLQAMLGLSDILRMPGVGPQEAREQLDDLEELLHRGTLLTRQLLLFSRQEEPRAERCDLNEVVTTTAKLLRRLVRENVQVVMDLAVEPLHLVADHAQLGQVWMNLAVNAVDAMPDGGCMTVRSGWEGRHHVWFSVADTGHGIPEDVRAHLFEPFFSTKDDQRGTGLGLAVVHGIVTGHRGRVEVETTLGAGSCFRVVLPVGARTPSVPDAGIGTEAPLPRGDGQTILLVEDNQSVRSVFERLLRGLGYVVVSADSAEAAEQVPDLERVAVLLTDMMLPGASGRELAQRLQLRRPDLRVIFMSGYTEDEVVRRGAADGSARFLQKPVDLDRLAREVQAALA
jgi:PAS domain S-box-containing protein